LKTTTHVLDVRLKASPDRYQVLVGRHLLKVAGQICRSLGSQSGRVAIISNKKVFGLHGAPLIVGLKLSKFDINCWMMGDGERFKSVGTFEKALKYLADKKFERSDFVIALGGGVVGDLAGFVAASYLRGVPLVQIPTTLTAQIDSAIGGKTGINLPRGKNLVGAFYQPQAVLVDAATLRTLPQRELTSGWCEAVKNGAVGSRKLFEGTSKFLTQLNAGESSLSDEALETLVMSHCRFKVSIVKQDEQEDLSRADSRSRRILNFGHTVGHALEAATQYKRFRHGEAVGHGMLVAGEISKTLGLLPESELELLRGAVRLCGPLPSAAEIDPDQIIKLIVSDKKSVRGKVQWVLLEGIGRPRIVDGKQIPARLLRDALRKGLRPGS
jgi:3-dehydroquinate synthase